ncbi:glucose-6-phosphate isomerase [Isachenkonia alkalipeptolytica]|uniref:Glucose-6-phosphate isomerase n=1 Tax=Isachenkonia alkalipeptolytica TaxID=2565777 RepID=A0AA43XK96_9CLOT|nr:glucose-6-phosphate isomerase [Isachenkonia alkalipeptolytica]NBG88383.1 glucose-6-phosphate isomerase [Isachenkonia alkalipeptolytica]
MEKISLDAGYLKNMIGEEELFDWEDPVEKAHYDLHNEMGKGNDFVGWVNQPRDFDMEELEKVQETAKRLRENTDIFLVVGIGGSYLGAKAGIEMLTPFFYNDSEKLRGEGPRVYFAGHHLSGRYLEELLQVLEEGEVSINIISKSGTTTEPAVAFRILKNYMENRYGKKEAAKRIVATTDREKGALKELADKECYETFIVPDDIGGRYSVLSPVGMLPMAVAGINVEDIVKGAKDAYAQLLEPEIKKNPCYQYSVYRNILYGKGKKIEILANFDPRLTYFGEWFKQLFGESEGKEGKGIFPATLNFTTDLHSMGQYIQEGERTLFVTVLRVEDEEAETTIAKDHKNLDGLNYLTGKTLGEINEKALQGTLAAHYEGEVPGMILTLPKLDAYYFGYMVYFFMKACGLSGYLLGVNPFDQPGVEAYKKNMFRLLGKPQ